MMEVVRMRGRDLRRGLYWQGFTDEERRALRANGFRLGRPPRGATPAIENDDEITVLRILIRRELGMAVEPPEGLTELTEQEGGEAPAGPNPERVMRLVAELGRQLKAKQAAGGESSDFDARMSAILERINRGSPGTARALTAPLDNAAVHHRKIG
jgi:hypothetical protein